MSSWRESPIHPLMFPLLVLAVSAPAVHFGQWAGLPWALSSLVLFGIPTIAAALFCRFRDALFTCAIASIVCTLVPAVAMATGKSAGWPELGSALLCSLALIVLGGGVALVVQAYRRNLEHARQRCEQAERELYQFRRKHEAPDAAQDASAEAAPDGVAKPTEVNYPILMVRLQDIGRRISTSLDLDSVCRAVVETGRELLKCQSCRPFLLDEQNGLLIDKTDAAERDGSTASLPADEGMLGWVVQNRQILTLDDTQSNYALQDLAEQSSVRPYACAPLLVGGQVVGVLTVDGVKRRPAEFDRLLYILANFSGMALKNAQLFTQIQEMARRDGLTGLLNHSSLHEELARLLNEDRSRARPVTLILADVDHFKEFNDTYGHPAGDFVLRQVAATFERLLDEPALLARYGGEEFACVLPGRNLKEGERKANELREALERQAFRFEGSRLHVTASFGVASSQGGLGSSDLIRMGDQALYEAKRAGRNRVVTAADPAPQAALS